MTVDNTGSLHLFTPTPSIPGWTETTGGATPTASASVAIGVENGNVTTCLACDIDWTYVGAAPDTMEIGIYGVRTDYPSVLINQTITTLDGGIEGENSITWSPVNVSQGVYKIYALVPSMGIVAFSSDLLVFNGSVTSCLSEFSPPTSSSSASTPAPTSASSTTLQASISSNGSATNTPALGAVSGSRSMSGGGIAGAVIGSLAAVLVALVALVFFLRRRRGRSAFGVTAGAGLFEKKPRGAVGIGSRGGSFSSAHGRSGAAFDAQNNAAGSTFGPGYRSGSAISRMDSNRSADYAGLGGERPDTQTAGPFSSPYDDIVAMPLDTHVASHSRKHDSSGSVFSGSTAINSPIGFSATNTNGNTRPSQQSSYLDPFSTQPNTPSPRPSGEYFDAYGNVPGRQGQVPVQLFSPPLNTSNAQSLSSHSQGVPRDVSSASSSTPDLAQDPLTVGTPALATARRAPPPPPLPTSVSGGPRNRNSRKPAPVYAPSAYGEVLELVEPASPRSTAPTDASASASTPTTAIGPGPAYHFLPRGSLDHSSHSRASLVPSSSAGNDWSSAAAHSHSTPSPAHSAVHLPALSRSLSEQGGLWPELNHKSSFGDRQLHYLIPDPPSQQMK